MLMAMGNLRNAKVRKGILRNDVRNALWLVNREMRISQIIRRCCGSGNRCRRLARTPVVRPFITRRTQLRTTKKDNNRTVYVQGRENVSVNMISLVMLFVDSLWMTRSSHGTAKVLRIGHLWFFNIYNFFRVSGTPNLYFDHWTWVEQSRY